eukprot:SAG31_NODE_1336_length_8738_cov_4.855655_9_plen_91_part_00
MTQLYLKLYLLRSTKLNLVNLDSSSTGFEHCRRYPILRILRPRAARARAPAQRLGMRCLSLPAAKFSSCRSDDPERNAIHVPPTSINNYN